MEPDATQQAEAERLEEAREQLRLKEAERARRDVKDEDAMDPECKPGVPPPTTDDYDELVDIEGAESFPASDPPSHY